MIALVLAAAGIYLFIVGRAQQGRLYFVVDDLMGEQAAGFLFSMLGGSLLAVAFLWMISGLIA